MLFMEANKMNQNQRRMAIVAQNLRLMATAAESATEASNFVALMQGLQVAISLISLCMFSRQKKFLQNIAHDLDKNEMKGVL